MRACRPLLLLSFAASVFGEDKLTVERPDVQPPDGAPGLPYDPYRGIDRDGRIPKARLPADLPNPEHWRYVPEGRIKPGSIFERFFVTWFVSPIFYFEEDVGLGGGLSITDIDFRLQRRREFGGIFFSRSTEGQERYSLVWQRKLNHRELPGGGVISEEGSFIRAVGGYERTLTERFFGLGPDTQEGDETSYTGERSTVHLMGQMTLPQPGDSLALRGGIRAEHHNLTRGRVSGRPSTDDVYPALVAAGDSRDALWLALALRWDTRDSGVNPYRGWMAEFGVDTAPYQQGDGFSGNQTGAIWTGRASWSLPLPGLIHSGGVGDEENPPTDSVAVGAMVQWATGDLPFYELPSLGGRDTLRGFIGNRFTDRAAWHASAEYRVWVVPRGYAITDSVRIERLGIAPFYDIGSVAPRLGDLDRSRVHDSIGIGLRAMLERTALFRFDLAHSDDGFGFNIAFGLSF